jgi:hypothetical protein
MLQIGPLYVQKAWKNDRTNWFVSLDECLELDHFFIIGTSLHIAARCGGGSMNLDFRRGLAVTKILRWRCRGMA